MRLIGITCPYCNASSIAYAGGSIFSDTFPGTVLDGGLDAVPSSGVTSAGISVARHTVYVEEGSQVFAYRPTSVLPRASGR
jgi:hypothetical protein